MGVVSTSLSPLCRLWVSRAGLLLREGRCGSAGWEPSLERTLCHGSPLCSTSTSISQSTCSGCRRCRSFGNWGWSWRVTVLKQPQLAGGPNPLRPGLAELCPGQGGLQGVMPSSGSVFWACGGSTDVPQQDEEEEAPVWQSCGSSRRSEGMFLASPMQTSPHLGHSKTQAPTAPLPTAPRALQQMGRPQRLEATPGS